MEVQSIHNSMYYKLRLMEIYNLISLARRTGEIIRYKIVNIEIFA